MRKHLQVVCAVIQRDDKILVCQRNAKTAHAGKWEFPGGKINSGESAPDALHREIREELSLSIHICNKLTEILHHYPDFDISLHPFLCKISTQQVTDALTPIAHEHAQICWMTPQEALSLDWSEADIPVLQEIIDKN